MARANQWVAHVMGSQRNGGKEPFVRSQANWSSSSARRRTKCANSQARAPLAGFVINLAQWKSLRHTTSSCLRLYRSHHFISFLLVAFFKLARLNLTSQISLAATHLKLNSKVARNDWGYNRQAFYVKRLHLISIIFYYWLAILLRWRRQLDHHGRRMQETGPNACCCSNLVWALISSAQLKFAFVLTNT